MWGFSYFMYSIIFAMVFSHGCLLPFSTLIYVWLLIPMASIACWRVWQCMMRAFSIFCASVSSGMFLASVSTELSISSAWEIEARVDHLYTGCPDSSAEIVVKLKPERSARPLMVYPLANRKLLILCQSGSICPDLYSHS